MELLSLNLVSLVRVFGFMVASFVFFMGATPFMTDILYGYKLWKKPKDTAITGEPAAIFQKLHARKHRQIPTMAGVLIWLVVALITFSFNLSRAETFLPLFALVAFGTLGLVDDIVNLKSHGGIAGLSFWAKLAWLVLLSALGAWWFVVKLNWTSIHIPGGNLMGLPHTLELGYWYIPLFMLVIVATANAVNLTDGLDGLAGGLLAVVFSAYTIIALVLRQFDLAAFTATVAGATLAYTWFNIPPARFYMGDTGSLALGATLGVIAMLTNTALILPVIGAVFVAEVLSVLIQIGSKKLFKRKVFASTPFHHHLEWLGWGEAKVVMRLWVIGAIFAVIGLFIALLGKG